jgi:hypothetical protein
MIGAILQISPTAGYKSGESQQHRFGNRQRKAFYSQRPLLVEQQLQIWLVDNQGMSLVLQIHPRGRYAGLHLMSKLEQWQL